MQEQRARYKFSVYNCVVDNNDEIIIFNTLTKNIKVIKSEDYWFDKTIIEYLEKCDSLLLNELKELGFIVDNSLDEKTYAEVLHLKKVFSNDTLELTILPTDACNFNCVYCFENERDHHMDSQTAESVIKFIDRNAKYYKSICINWFGGEPTIEKDTVLHIMGAAKQICRKNRISLIGFMTTNGYELDINTFNAFVENGIRFYQITIDGTEQCHNKMRPHKNTNDSFQTIIKNLTDISRLMHTGNLAFNIGVRFNVSKSNVEDIRQALKQYAILFKNDKRFSVIWQWIRDWGGERISKELSETSNNAKESCRRLYQEAIEMGIQCAELLSCNSGREFCEAGRKNAYVINYNGDVLKCAMALYNQSQSVIEKNHIGYIKSNGIMKIDPWKESLWLKFPERLEKCNECIHYPMCMNSCCPLSSKINDHSRCSAYKQFINEQITNYAYIKNGRYSDG